MPTYLKTTWVDKETALSADNFNNMENGIEQAQNSANSAQSKADTADGKADTNATDLSTHKTDVNNPHSVSKAQVGLSNVDNTSDADKPVSTAQQTALNGKSDKGHKHTEADISDLDKYTKTEVDTKLGGKSDKGHTHVEADITDLDKYTKAEVDAKVGGTDGALDTHKTDTTNPHSVTKAQVGLGNVDNTSDADKPVSTAQQTALDGKANSSHTHAKSEVGLGNVDNTSDADKPVSTAQQTALNGKANSSHGHNSIISVAMPTSGWSYVAPYYEATVTISGTIKDGDVSFIVPILDTEAKIEAWDTMQLKRAHRNTDTSIKLYARQPNATAFDIELQITKNY